MDTIVIIMPTYNEAANIQGMIDDLAGKIFPSIPNAKLHLLIVDDHSPDGTGEIVEKAMQTYKSVSLLKGPKRGLGHAYVRGMEYAMHTLAADAIIEMDADYQHPPSYVKNFVANYQKGAEYIIGSRYIPGGGIPVEWAFYRKAISYFGNLLIKYSLFEKRIHDFTSGFRLTKVRNVLNTIELKKLMALDSFAFKVDLLDQTLQRTQKIMEIPLQFALRQGEKSKFNLKEIMTTLRVAFWLCYKKHPFIKFGTVGFTGYIVNAVSLWLLTLYALPGVFAWGVPKELSVLYSFMLNNRWTFREKKTKNATQFLHKLLHFHLLAAAGLAIQTLLGSLSDRFLGIAYRQPSLIIIIIVTFPLNYLISHYFIWGTADRL